MTKDTRLILLFIAATFLVSWGMAGVFALTGGQWATPEAFTLALAYMLIPGIAAIFIEKYAAREPVMDALAIRFRPNRWFLAAWLIPVALMFGALGVSLLFPGVTYSPGLDGFFARYGGVLSPEQVARMRAQTASSPIPPIWFVLLNGLLAGATVNAFFALGEELGWRGFLVRRLDGMGFWKMSGIIGVIWGVWHAPIIAMGHNYPHHPVAGIGMMTAFALLLTPLLLHIRLRAHSTVAAAVFHGTVNALAGLPILVLAGGGELTVGITGLAGFIVLGIADLALYLAYRRGTGREKPRIRDGEL